VEEEEDGGQNDAGEAVRFLFLTRERERERALERERQRERESYSSHKWYLNAQLITKRNE
jgi:hypothetical protein